MRYPATEATLKIDAAVKREIRCDRPEAVILILVKSSDFCHFDFPLCHFEAKREISCCRERMPFSKPIMLHEISPLRSR